MELREIITLRPLVMQRNGGWNFFYTHDGNKNVSDVVSFQQARGVPAHYEYAPFGEVTVSATNTAFTAFNVATTNPYRFSSEYADDALGLVYYNYRHYDLMFGRWICMNFVDDGANRYNFVCNVPIGSIDVCGEEKRSLTYVSDQPGFNYAEFIADLTHINEDTSTPTDFRPNELLGEGDCIERLTVMMHGGATRNNERAIVQWGDTVLEENAHQEEISNMFSNVCFCNECTIELRACNIGNSLYLKNRLEEKTGCKIILYNRAVGSFGIHNEK